MKAFKIILRIVAWVWAAFAVFTLWQDRKDLENYKLRVAETTRRTKNHF